MGSDGNPVSRTNRMKFALALTSLTLAATPALARALRGAAVGELRRVSLPGGEKEWEVTAISYPPAAR